MTAPELLYQMESDILANILRLLSRGAIGSAQWQIEKLEQLGTLRSLNARAVKKSLPDALKAAQEEIKARALQGAASVDAVAKTGSLAQALPVTADAKLKAVYDAWYVRNAADFNRMSASMLKSSEAIYTKTVEKVTAEVLAGAKTGRQAIAETATQWGKDGLKAFTDKAGHKWTTESYAQTITRTTTNNARRDASFQRMDDYGLDLVEISSHVGARPNCEPYQGKVYSRNGKTKGYPLLSSTSIGEVDGILGINCTHQVYAYIPGAEKTYKPYPKRENDAAYKESQQQRLLERTIRTEKRGLQLAQETGDKDLIAQYKARVSAKQENMRDFISETDRTRRRDREQIY